MADNEKCKNDAILGQKLEDLICLYKYDLAILYDEMETLEKEIREGLDTTQNNLLDILLDYCCGLSYEDFVKAEEIKQNILGK